MPGYNLQVPLTVKLRRVLVLKNLAIMGQMLAMMAVAYGLGMPLPFGALAAALLAVNLLTWLRLCLPWRVSEIEVFALLLLDVLLLALWLYLAGGATNPFVLLLLLPLIIAAVTVRAVYTWIMLATVLACYSLLLFVYIPLPHFHITYSSQFDLQTIGMWSGFALSAGIMVYFVVKMGATLRAHERLLAETREHMLRDRHIVRLGTLAVSAAHELGTPLATMAVLTRELEHEYAAQPELKEKLYLLRGQVERCKQSLSGMLSAAGQERCDAACGVACDDYLRVLLEQWRATRGRVRCAFHWEGESPAPRIAVEETLNQALVNILNNAADAGDPVEMVARCDAASLRVAIYDRGAGVTPQAQSNAGRRYFSTKADGRGLGLMLANAVFTRLGGALCLTNRPDGGACVEVTLPLDRLVAARA